MNRKVSATCISLIMSSSLCAHDSRLYEADWQGHVADEPGWVETLTELILNPAEAAALISIEGEYRVIHSDGKPDHETGRFPNRNNPHSVVSRSKTYRVAANPIYKEQTYALGLWPFGVALNGIPFDPGAAEFWQRDVRSGWQYEALGGAVNLGMDWNNAHVQPTGTYHYHGLPIGLLERFTHMKGPVHIGYAADGFPIYGPMGYSDPKDMDSSIVELKGSYRIKQGNRNGGPGGRYDGSFIQDYEYIKGLGNLDDCNGRFGVTPEYPEGTYYYVITDQFPFIPRCFHGEPDRSFMRGGPQPGGSQGMRTHSNNDRDHGRNRPMGGPPQEAITACIGKREGDKVSLITPRGHRISASCQRRAGQLFAIPQR
ncbi:YHYH protein [Neptuniibacter sp. SY11_33]|uniref:YHYH protein n=1 Tax=Neptuniibacter sp. SY11_33 TaxID=3398215 RepID=UPI0039F600DB